MKNLLDRVPTYEQKDFKIFLSNGQKLIFSNRQWCDLTISDFTTFYFESYDGKLADALVKFLLNANCNSSNTLLALLGFQEFAKDALIEFLEINHKSIIKEFNFQKQDAIDERKIIAAGY
ncbi:hypothetical protein IHC87_18360 [Photobacterium damselae subsp. damselae]|uniref:hypothetical protein n=1 Tax=Photobacterium damselae TaxID=38293 RepID=UPI001F36950E|nr:hypothetical protein [Photobacterium damselae]UJZ95418.1 hypothetical protein IHC87_18360 [Photobacterium damselae subsp. damselae]UJZ99567.1 hypothetical protein IHC88_19130 [Photobacterium damselae subsp. damselae]